MLLQPDMIQTSINRLRSERLKPRELAERIGEGSRARFASTSVKRQRYASLLAETGDPVSAQRALERLIGGNDLVGINYLERGTICSHAVCRINLRNAQGDSIGFGTGFLVAPGVVMTNHHVISGAQDAANALAEFDYEQDASGENKPAVAFPIQVEGLIAYQPLDFCLAAVGNRSTDGRHSLDEYGWLVLDGTPGKTIIGEYLTIIQHPGGERKQVCVRENKLIKYDDVAPTLWYETDTVAGSSGSPVFNQSWQVVALHHSGVPKTDAQGRWLTVDGGVWDQSMDESRVQWIANEGIRISQIVAYLKSSQAGNALAQAVTSAAPSPIHGGTPERADSQNGLISQTRDGELQLTIPVRVAVRIDGPLSSPRATVPAPMPAALTPPKNGTPLLLGPGPSTDGMEVVNVDQSNYNKRTGYVETFLGNGGMRVPLPVLKPSLKAHALPVKNGAKKGSELKYWDYTVVMHKVRKLAIFSAVNVDASLRPKDAGRDGDRWYTDTRIPATAQIGAEFYGQQKTLEADREKNPFDRGHLVRRLDAQWGQTPALSKRNGDDSFHWTNCSPQHWQFNQGVKRWLGLEDYVISTFAGGRKACVINGPVFDAPLSKLGPGGRLVPTLDGPNHKDPTFGGVSIPKMFYKIVACERSDGGLGVAAFLMSQEDFLSRTSRIKGMPALKEEKLTAAEARLFQVSVADIEALTDLSFGPLAAADTKAHEVAGVPGPRAIDRMEDVRIG